MSPISLSFWDPGSRLYWRDAYAPNERSQKFAAAIVNVPQAARVASTDYAHTRLTHFERSYDYSGYRRRVAGYEEAVPSDTDYIVIDTGHRYSTMRSPDDIRELRDRPDEWTLLPDRSDGEFLLLQRRAKP